MEILYALVFLLLPAAVLYVVHHQRWAQKIGVIVLCYIAGLLAGNFGWVPEEAVGVQKSISEVTVALALPMLLFTLDIRQWSKMAGRAMLSMLFAITSVVTLATLLFYLLRGEGGEATSHLAAMAVGLYTGGTPNLAAIKAALDIPHSQYIVFHSLDTVLGGVYLLAMLTVGIPFFRWLLGKPSESENGVDSPAVRIDESQAFETENYAPLFHRENTPQLGQILALSGLILGVSLGLSQWAKSFFELQSNSALTIVFLTTFGMLLSFNGRVRALALSYRTGMYLIYIFCFTVATMASVDELAKVNFSITVFVFGTIGGSLLLHALLCKLAGVDSDTFMVTSVSAICSPPFVPLLVKALGNPGLLLSGMTTGIIGYALGNYLGISLALLLQS